MWSNTRSPFARAALALALLVWLVPASVASADDPPKAEETAKRTQKENEGKKENEAGKENPTQEREKPNAQSSKPKEVPALTLKEPVSGRVYQRGVDEKADIPVVIDGVDQPEDVKIDYASVIGPSGMSLIVRLEDGKLVGVPTGGPYRIMVRAGVGTQRRDFQVENVYVGDLWILAGQSNMEGVGDLLDVQPPSDEVRLLGMDGKWTKAEEPLHWLVDSPDPVHSGNPDDRAARSAAQHKTRTKGAGLGLAFADAMVKATGVPIGLVATAHGGTSMEQWSPSKRGEGGNSLYGSFLRQVKLAGGKAKGVLWYQGESDAMSPDATKIYSKTFEDFIAAVRDDLGRPDLPFYYVQIGRFIIGGNPHNWNAVQDAERLLTERVPNTAVVASIDLELDDIIHISTQGQKRVGKRLANIALRELFGQAGATTPTLDRVNKGPKNTLVVKFKGVNIAPERTQGNGVGGGMRGPGGQGMMAVPETRQGAGFRQMGVRAPSPLPHRVVGLKPERHIAGFSIRKEDGTDIPLIFDAAVGPARDTVILKLTGAPPAKSYLHYGYGFDPYCNLVDALDMAVPVFGPVPLDEAK